MIKILIGVLIVAALAVGGIFVSDYMGKTAKAESLVEQIQRDNKNLTTISTSTQNLVTEINEITAETNELLDTLAKESKEVPDRINTNNIVNSVLTLGQACDVTVIPLSTQDWAKVKIGENDYLVYRMTVEVYGTHTDVLGFIRQLQGLYNTLAVESLTLEKKLVTPTPSPTATTTPLPVTMGTVNVKMAVYAR